MQVQPLNIPERSENYIREYHKVLPVDLCHNLIALFKENSKDQGPSTVGIDSINLPIRNSDTIPITGHSAFTEVDRELNLILLKRYKHYRQTVLSSYPMESTLYPEGYQLIKYKQNKGYFRAHIDVGEFSSCTRALSVLVYLNTVDEGGETDFPEWGVKIKAEIGKVIIFPPYFTHLHEGLMPISSDKYILATWLGYKSIPEASNVT